ncbi:hypothetical protein E0765_01640 [Sulfuricurvum sp. IAE1]|uniref:hypothetical protein n=1 Tax=Sulfuricurvum sp. IAE1 TaxID=2546102 RepID=UPI00104AB61B|nr:hypothetical protein [Sulfuricurvum sp. IAE1]TDA69146.1 hypothetical protein E0765_01640 [Sulfuricurvum sp. IAE1]
MSNQPIAMIEHESGLSPTMDGAVSAEASPASCLDGHLRSNNYNGYCYCQVCCGGTWQYVWYIVDGKKYWLMCNGGSVRVNCNGRQLIVSCA